VGSEGKSKGIFELWKTFFVFLLKKKYFMWKNLRNEHSSVAENIIGKVFLLSKVRNFSEASSVKEKDQQMK
jgi:hypothetical protein